MKIIKDEDKESNMIFDDSAKLTTDEKAILIMQRGSLISSSEFLNLSIDLYRVDDDFIEIWYSTSADKVYKIEFLKEKAINPFLKYLKISCNN